MANLIKYVEDPHSKKVYKEESLAAISAVDPFHWDTDIQNLKDKVLELQAQIDDINNVQIPAKEAEKADYFNQFPQ